MTRVDLIMLWIFLVYDEVRCSMRICERKMKDIWEFWTVSGRVRGMHRMIQESRAKSVGEVDR